MASLLGEVHFEDVPGKAGRVRCVETGHEMLATDKASYGQSKRCRRALFDLCLSQRKPPLNVFEQSPISKDKVICKLTGDLLNKSEDAIWKHMNGKKFLRKLGQKEDEKKSHAQKGPEGFMDVEQIRDKDLSGTDQIKENHACSIEGDEDENMDTEESDFWVPPGVEQDSDYSEDGFLPSADQGHEKESMNDKCATLKGIKRKMKKGNKRPGALKKLRSDAVS